MTFTLCTSGNIVTKAGSHVSSTLSTSGNVLSQISDEVEGYLCEVTGYDWVTNYADVSTQVQKALQGASSSLGGMILASMDSTGYQGKEFEVLMNMNDGIVENTVNKLKDSKFSDNLKTP